MSDLSSAGQFVSRFANPKRSTPVELGPCHCPGQPHADGDRALVRAEIGEGELQSAMAIALKFRPRTIAETADLAARLADGTIDADQYAQATAAGFSYIDTAVRDDSCLARFTTSWTLLRPVYDAAGEAIDGKTEPAPIDLETAQLLDDATRTPILEAIQAAINRRTPLPNAPGAPSRDSRRASASRTPKTQRRR